MNPRPDANWWCFSVDPAQRGETIRDDPDKGTVEVNPEFDGKRLLSYHRYLRLDTLLSAQAPTSRAPDERIFIIAHQMFELVFRQMIFDLRVIAATFRAVMEAEGRELFRLTGLGTGDNAAGAEDFWRPASTSAARIRHSCKRMVPSIMGYLATDELFDNREFTEKFRPNLAAASGFQSAQFRLIQRALGKSPLLAIRLFPADFYLKNYLGMDDAGIMRAAAESENAGLVRLVDGLILREGADIATPPHSSPYAPVAELDKLAHDMLTRISSIDELGRLTTDPTCPVPMLPDDEISFRDMEDAFRERMREGTERIRKKRDLSPRLTEDEMALLERKGRVFKEDWSRAVRDENARRARYGPACGAARFLCADARTIHFRDVFDALIEADRRLSEGFLLAHLHVVKRRLGEVPGTAGSGAPFLDFSQTLTVRFPALIAVKAARWNNLVTSGKGKASSAIL
ncbi:MAG: hypothetical protein C4526_02945 [Nitrospiraceae bacterium]|nr:MAG: hypothetical protein C4526_02945 [Nitrospiraceae bacterium]